MPRIPDWMYDEDGWDLFSNLFGLFNSTQNVIEDKGFGGQVSVPQDDLDRSVKLLKENNITVRSVSGIHSKFSHISIPKKELIKAKEILKNCLIENY